MEKKTPLYDLHVELGGKIVPFAGYLLPVQYGTGVIAEHMAVRTKAGLFDVSHMAEIVLEGPDALRAANMLTTVHVEEMVDGQVKYSPMCNEQGGIVDDLMVYRLAADKYLFVVNAANHEKDVAFMSAHISGDVKMTDISESVAQLALQGPAAEKIFQKICPENEIPQVYYTFVEHAHLTLKGGKVIDAIVSKTGYTGEDGYEIYCAPEDSIALAKTLLDAGRDEGLIPCGLGARDTLRMEAAMPLYGHELNDELTPKESGIGFFCKMDKEDFIGKAAIEAKGLPTIKRVGLKITGRGIAREHSDVYVNGEKVGVVTSGTHCPFIGQAIAMAYLPKPLSEVGQAVQIDVRGRMIDAEVVKLPFYKKPAKD
ncbi:MAG: glycine cleavage system aminomethyltransferase GcvT [Clostridia bacterium]|nr:glycine cleavage system aminomethyltransferase GcvT [Clostridia bacterium]